MLTEVLSNSCLTKQILQKWPSDPQHFTQEDLDLTLEVAVTDPDAGMGPNEVSSAPNITKPLWKRGRPVSK